MNNLKTTIGVVVFLALLVFMSSVYTITQGYDGLLLRLGKLVRSPDTKEVVNKGPGLHFKLPLIENIRTFDTRLQTLDIKSSRIVTKEKKDVIVDYYAKWKISDIPQYFKSTGGNEFKAETLLEQKLNTSLRAEFGKRTIADVVSGERDDVMDILQSKANEQAKGLGISVIDVRIKGIDLPPNTSNAIYQRMRADMEKIANKHRGDGRAAAEAIRAAADAKATVIVAKASSNGKLIKAKGQAEAAAIYAKAFSKDKDFFAFYRSLKAYENSLNSKQDVLVLDQSSQFFNYFRHSLKSGDGATRQN
jgi:modulator of FtsH protease HflC